MASSARIPPRRRRRIGRSAIVIAAWMAFLGARPAPSEPEPPLLLSDVVRDLAYSYAEGLVLMSLTSDELEASSGVPAYAAYDEGFIDDDSNTLLVEFYAKFTAAMQQAEDYTVQTQLDYAAGLANDCDLHQAYRYEAVAFIIAGEWFNEWELNGVLLGETQTDALFDSAVVNTQQAITTGAACGVDVTLERALMARAFHSQGVWGLTDRTAFNPGDGLLGNPTVQVWATQVPTGFTWGLTLDPFVPSALEERLADATMGLGADYSQVDAVGGVGLIDPTMQSSDPTMPLHPATVARIQELTATGLTQLPFITGVEMRLMEAEASLDGTPDFASSAASINEARAHSAAAAIPAPLSLPEAISILVHERRANLVLRGARLSDLYRFGETSPTWVTGSDAESQPGSYLPLAAPVVTCVGTCDDAFAVSQVPAKQGLVIYEGKELVTPAMESCFFTALAVHEAMNVAPTGRNVLAPDGFCTTAATLFSPEGKLTYGSAVPWTDLTDLVPVASDTAYVIPLKIWKDATDPTPDAVIQTHVDHASAVFMDSRVGVRFVADIETQSDADWTTVDFSCAGADYTALTTPHNLAGVLNVYWVSSIVPDPMKPTNWSRGLMCQDPGDPEERSILIHSDELWGSTLAHELGHALIRMGSDALWHTDGAFLSDLSFPAGALMSTYGATEVTRDTLTLGQAFRANVHEESWLNLGERVDMGFNPTGVKIRDEPASTRWCPCNPLRPSPCLPIRLAVYQDMVDPQQPWIVDNPPPPIVDGWLPWGCQDRLELEVPKPASANEAAMILDGVQRGVVGCADDLAVWSDPDNTRFLATNAFHQFSYEDLLDPGACNAEYVLFSQNHRLLLQSYTAADFSPPLGPGTDSRSVLTINAAVSPQVVDILVWTGPGTNVGLRTQAIDAAKVLFEVNRAGLELNFSDQGVLPMLDLGADPCALTMSDYTAGFINVYWIEPGQPGSPIPANRQGHQCGVANDLVFVHGSGGASEPELAHQLGHAFGLLDLDSSNQPEFLLGALESNIMFQGGASPIPNDRDRFTLGQVFRMYFLQDSYLNALVGFPQRCATGPSAQCPELSLDVPR